MYNIYYKNNKYGLTVYKVVDAEIGDYYNLIMGNMPAISFYNQERLEDFLKYYRGNE